MMFFFSALLATEDGWPGVDNEDGCGRGTERDAPRVCVCGTDAAPKGWGGMGMGHDLGDRIGAGWGGFGGGRGPIGLAAKWL